MKIAVVGSRDHADPEAVRMVLHGLPLWDQPQNSVVTGDCPTGVDAFVRKFMGDRCEVHECEKSPLTGRWIHKGAGMERNSRVVAAADRVVVIFWRVVSPGSYDVAVKAMKFHKPLQTYHHGLD